MKIFKTLKPLLYAQSRHDIAHKQAQQKAVFLDRDGVINKDHGYVSKSEDFDFIEGTFQAVRNFQEQGYLPIIITNQSGIARGYYNESDFSELSQWMVQQFLAQNVEIVAVYYCPHHPHQGIQPYVGLCECRKPNPGMLQEAIRKFNIQPKQSIFIGDKLSDIEAAKAAQLGTTVLVKSGQTLTKSAQQQADFVFENLYDSSLQLL